MKYKDKTVVWARKNQKIVKNDGYTTLYVVAGMVSWGKQGQKAHEGL
jgi:hypothetical protein